MQKYGCNLTDTDCVEGGNTWCAIVLVGEEAQAEDGDTHCAGDEDDRRDATSCRVRCAASHVLTGLWPQKASVCQYPDMLPSQTQADMCTANI